MKSWMMAAFGCVLLAFVGGCKSVETRSAILHNDAGRHDLAIETAQQALASNPNDAEAYFQLGVAYSKLDSAGLAYHHFVRSSELDPTREKMVNDNIQSNFAKHYNRALNFQKQDDLTSAAEEFDTATLADPRQAKGFFMLGATFEQLGDSDPTYYEKAVPAFDKVLELATPADKHYIDALKHAGRVLAKIGRPQEAESRFSRLIEEDPTNYRIIEQIGYDALEAKDWKSAAVFLDLAARARARIGAEDFNLYYNIGVAHFQQRKEDEAAIPMAVSFYEKALELQPDEPQTVFNILVAYVAGEQWQQAIIWGEKYVGTTPDNADAWRLLSRSYSELGDDSKARECASRYEEIVKKGGSN